MSRLTRPPYILAHPADFAGCGYHRIRRPLEIMAKAGYAHGRADMMFWPDDRILALNPDIVVFQRQHEAEQVESMRRLRKLLPKAFLVYEIDDCLSAVPPWSPHAVHMPENIDKQMAAAIAECQAVTVTTGELATHVRSVCAPDTDVRIIPNMLGRDELAKVDEILGNRQSNRKPRIGWGGGFAHQGDLELLVPAMREFQGRVEWVFVGQRPECEVPVEFHGGVSPHDYLTFLATLRLDLIVAPLVDCKFNRCKSNLRLLEAGALGCPVIASPVTPYMTGLPPVVHADKPFDWIDRLREFLAGDRKFREIGSSLRRWVERHYGMDDQLDRRVEAWLPKGTKAFRPRPRTTALGVALVSSVKQEKNSRYSTSYSTLLKACESSGGDLVFVRPGTLISDDQIARLLRHLERAEVASVVPLSNDATATGFPRAKEFTPVEADRANGLDSICRRLFGSVQAALTNPSGPVVALSRRALAVVGFPNEDDDPEAALVEWGVRAAACGFTNAVAADVYVVCAFPHPLQNPAEVLGRCTLRYPIRQLPPDPLLAVRQELDLAYHREFYVEPLPSANVTYAEWAALFNTVGERDLEWLERNQPDDLPISVITYPTTTTALGSFVAQGGGWAIMCHQTSELAEHAPGVFIQAIKENPDKLLFYADHDFRQENGICDRHDFKPAVFDKHLALQRDYLTPIFAVHVPTLLSLLTASEECADSVQLYRLLLEVPPQKIGHVPRVLAHLHERPPAELLVEVRDKCRHASAVSGLNIEPNPRFPLLGSLSYAAKVPNPQPLVSVIVPTGGRLSMLSPCLKSLLRFTDYHKIEVLIVENGPLNAECHDFCRDLAAKDTRVWLLRDDNPFNWSGINNAAVKKSTGEYLLFLNDDTRVLEPHWLAEMVGAAQVPGVGAVGARLLYPHGVVQHIGVVSRSGMTGHMHKGLHESSTGYNGIAITSHEATAVTGACMLVRRSLFAEVGGFDEQLAHNFNDVAFCLELRRRGYVNVVAAQAQLHHLEGMTRPSGVSQEGHGFMMEEGRRLAELYPEPDPYWNPNLFFVHFENGVYVSGLNCDLLQWPPLPWPWRDRNWPREHVLLVGDDGSGWVAESQKGNVVFFSILNGFTMQIARPVLGNTEPFDVRESEAPSNVLGKLGISRIVVRSILGGTVETLPFLRRLGIPLEYRPNTPEAICPRLDFKTRLSSGEFGNCQEGWRRGLCQSCLEQNGSPYGCTSIVGWRDQWRRFLTEAELAPLAEPLGPVMCELYLEEGGRQRAWEENDGDICTA